MDSQGFAGHGCVIATSANTNGLLAAKTAHRSQLHVVLCGAAGDCGLWAASHSHALNPSCMHSATCASMPRRVVPILRCVRLASWSPTRLVVARSLHGGGPLHSQGHHGPPGSLGPPCCCGSQCAVLLLSWCTCHLGFPASARVLDAGSQRAGGATPPHYAHGCFCGFPRHGGCHAEPWAAAFCWLGAARNRLVLRWCC